MLTVVVSESPRHGFAAGPLVVLGHAVLELTLIVALVIGLGSLLERHSVQAAVEIGGGAMLVWMGASMALAVVRGRASLDWEHDAAALPRAQPVLAGILASLSNPYWLIWWATIGMAYLSKSYAAGALGVGAFYVGHIMGDLTWYSAVSGLMAAGRRFIGLSAYKYLLALCGVFLIVLAVVFLHAGVRGIS
jgi:threonine/homoserine/homoserine lactone efflux protein